MSRPGGLAPLIPPALLLAGHGSRDPAGVAAFTALRARVAAAVPTGVEVAGGFIELSSPPLRDAVTELARRGHSRLVTVPLVLSAAGHAKGDIPAALARERIRHPGMTWSYGRALGPHPALLDLLAARIAAAAGSTAAGSTAAGSTAAGSTAGGSAARGSTAAGSGADELPAVLLVGRGSTDPDANAEVCKVARLLWEGRELAFTETAFVSLTGPGVAEGLDRCRRLGARRIVVARYFLFPGVLPDRVEAQALVYASRHPGLDIRCTGVLGDCDEVAGLVVERYREALEGDIRMNCDTCMYRTPLPRLEHRVGAPQRPHHHPEDHRHVHAD